ncbi:P-loop containing nucleoside triphosphate hydrolase protein [Penicillium macrosclerotiorum]|uniref:P-loop containing nucleoside triphosphate hydrolase protein n=1 Tax=Penicillium macrosclerotiorum TaxID=303699 RepID=UPI00254920E3|nr:P-loop containing nucleoside triphosphate hydrolase protein [Penicillium macrosclerotiorum]KAJ5698189.1 P-loop containing nucleoside triphosphate hydrolase protein [Penicillium macrosclerotiorum]
MIWTLFPYGSRVIANPFKNSPQVFHVQQHSKEESTLGSNTNFVLICWTYDWDGSGLVRHVFDFRIPKYEGFKSIPELPCCPIKLYCQDGVSGRDLEQTLTERGKLFRQRCIPNHMVAQPVYRTDSFVLFPKTSGELFPSSDSQGDIEFSDSDAFSMSVILDSTLCKLHSTGIHSMGKFHPNSFGRLISVPRAHCKCQLCDNDGQYSLFEESFRGPGGDDSIANEMSMLLPPRLHAFVLDVKKWAQVLVNNLKETNDINNEEGWKKLALDDDHKRNIRAMVTSHFDRERRKIAKDDGGRDIHDFTHGKGEGLVIFLHGVPGVGKTMTAETLSLALKRPLLRIDASDLEHKNPNQVSEVFKRRFEMSSSWGALLLLDEADVFLQDRKRSEIDQNALVSVLLRELEYFRGVLIMTTNRPVTMDPAVRSRIHYAVRYKELNEVNIGKVWNTFFDQLNDTNCVPGERENIRKWFEDGGARTLARSKFTGRDVRNLFIGAQLLSYPMITRNNIKKVRQSICDFTADMAKVYHPKIQKNTAAGDDSD